MDGLQITFGGGVPAYQALLTALMPAVVAAGAALLGVWLTNDSVAKHKRADDDARRAEREAVETAATAREERDTALAALELVNHFERYALESANVLDEARRVNWHDVVKVPGLAPLPAWPVAVDWRLLGPRHAAWARNYEMKVELIKLGLKASWEDGDPMTFCDEVAEQSAMLGHDAWLFALALRETFDLDPFMFEGPAWNFVEFLETHATEARRQADELAARRAALKAAAAPNDV